MKEEEFKKHIGHQLAGFQSNEADAEALWSKIEPRLEKPKRRPALLWWLPLGLLLLGGLGVFGWRQDKAPELPFFVKKEVQPKEATSLKHQKFLEHGNINPLPERSSSLQKPVAAEIDFSSHSHLQEDGQAHQNASSEFQAASSLSSAPVAAIRKGMNQKTSTRRHTALLALEGSNVSPQASIENKSRKMVGSENRVGEESVVLEHGVQGQFVVPVPETRVAGAFHSSILPPSGESSPSDPASEYVQVKPNLSEALTQQTHSADSVTRRQEMNVDEDSATEKVSHPDLQHMKAAFDSASRPKAESHWYVLTGPLALAQNARVQLPAADGYGNLVPGSIETSYGWSLALGYQEEVHSLFRMGIQAGVSFYYQQCEASRKLRGSGQVVIDSATGAFQIRRGTLEQFQFSRWVYAPSLRLLGDLHSRNSRYGIRVGAGLAVWQGLASASVAASAFSLQPDGCVQLYVRQKDWEFNLQVQAQRINKDAIPGFEKARSQNLVLGFQIGKRF